MTVTVDVAGEQLPVNISPDAGFDPDSLAPEPATAANPETDTTVPLIKLAWARSGDKGDHANIGVIARDPAYLPYLEAALTETAVADWMGHTLNPDTGKVTRWSLPGIHGFNYLLEHSLGGGGVASLRIDPQGKAFAQQLLEFPVPIASRAIKK